MSDTKDNGQPPPLSPEDEAQINSIQQSALTLRDSMLGGIGSRSIDADALARYRLAMEGLRGQAKPLADKYPGNERAALVLTQIEAWLEN